MKRRMKHSSLWLLAFASVLNAQGAKKATMITTTENTSWTKSVVESHLSNRDEKDIVINPQSTEQTINGFGTCFNEQGWASLNSLSAKDREAIMKELFAPGIGASFSICRMPIGANDFSLNWYSYDESDLDFSMDHFSIDNDTKTLIPFIKNALKYNPNLQIWASPWSPPQWMKKNKHYAQMAYQHAYEFYAAQNGEKQLKTGETGKLVFGDLKMLVGSQFDSGLTVGEGKEGKEGTDMFIQKPEYLKAYALYFSKFVDTYQANGIHIFAVMPQNEFNSPQLFPSCCWTARSLSNFIGDYLGPAMKAKGVKVFFGTVERPNASLVDTVMERKSKEYIDGIGFQWAGKDALPKIHQEYPNLTFMQSEQECGNGDNDWKYATHCWDLMTYYLNNGVSIYEYWNTSLFEGGVSRWGWLQNSLVVVNPKTKSYHFTPEYYLLKHVSHFVKSGAKKISIKGQDKDILAFQNPDKSIILVLANLDNSQKTLHIRIGNEVYTPELKANSFNTLVIK